MKGLIKTGIVIAVFIAIGISVSIIINNDLNKRLAAAYETGFDEGRVHGYVEGFQIGNKAGYQEGSKTGYLQGNGVDNISSREDGFYFVYNPTYDELQQILAEVKIILVEDETGSIGETHRVVHDYAAAHGIRVAYVRSQIAREASEGMVWIYQLVAFETTDRGLIIIEPWSHREVKVEVGKGYRELNGLPPSGYDDTITKTTMVW